ncbi:MAG: hypothetical protein J0H47_01550 [Gammaproteobacteria bacterium]|nr:hypothetical protein [Gammaproteobacteria bacterium]
MTIVNIHRWNRLIHCRKEYFSSAMQDLLQNIDFYIDRKPWRVLKNDPTSTVVVLKVDDNYVVVKRANTKGWAHILRRFFTCSRAKKNWRNASMLLDIGIPTFSPIALMEERWGPLKWRSYFICSYIQGTEALEYFSRTDEPQEQTKEIATKIARMLQTLAKHWISHRDINLSNIILVDGEPWLIDLDSMRQHRFSFIATRGARRERERFINNCSDTPIILPEVLSLFGTIFNELDTCGN